MRILVICQHYWPEPYRLSDVCEALVKRGHDVHVITDVPNYPMGYIYKEYRHGKNREQVHNGVRITRTFTIGRRENLVFRLLNYISYSVSSTMYCHRLGSEYDVVFAYQTSPVMMSVAALHYGKKLKKEVLLYCLDAWPAVLSIIGLNRRSIIYKLFWSISKKIYCRASQIAVTSRSFIKYLNQEFGIDKANILYLPQYSEDDFLKVPLKKAYTKETINLLFAGNVGRAQDIPTILLVAQELKDKYNIVFHIVGDGSELNNCKKKAKNLDLSNIIFHGSVSTKEVVSYYESADACIVSLAPVEYMSLFLPGKMQTYMAAGRPILGVANGEIAKVIHEAQCGYCAPAGDWLAFAQVIKEFVSCENKEQLGRNARQYYLRNFDKSVLIDSLDRALTAL